MQYGCSTKPVQLWMAVLLTTLVISTTATAGQVTLVNGDSINDPLEQFFSALLSGTLLKKEKLTVLPKYIKFQFFKWQLFFFYHH